MITPAFGLTATERVLPRLALDFTTGLLDARVTFTRTTGASNPATYVDSSGYIVAATNNQARFDHSPVTLACKGLLIEEPRTNYATYSNSIFDASWTPSSVTAGTSITSPDGTANAVKAIASASDALHFFSKNATSVPTTVYSFSRYAKKGELTKFALREGSATGAYAAFDLENGTVLDGTGTIADAGNGFYRCTLNATLVGTTFGMRVYLLPNSYTSGSVTNTWTGDGTSGLYMYETQLEAGAFATSQIPTTTTALTRNADVATMTGTNFSDWFNASEGTFVAEFASYDSTTGRQCCAISADDGGTDRIQIGRTVTNSCSRAIVLDNASAQANISSATSSFALNTFGTCALAYKANSFFSGFNATALTPDTSGTVPTVNQLSIGNGAGVNTLNGYVANIYYWPQRLTNAEAQAFSK
jgi:hypothetical protein